jgi:hypothetical protein
MIKLKVSISQPHWLREAENSEEMGGKRFLNLVFIRKLRFPDEAVSYQPSAIRQEIYFFRLLLKADS